MTSLEPARSAISTSAAASLMNSGFAADQRNQLKPSPQLPHIVSNVTVRFNPSHWTPPRFGLLAAQDRSRNESPNVHRAFHRTPQSAPSLSLQPAAGGGRGRMGESRTGGASPRSDAEFRVFGLIDSRGRREGGEGRGEKGEGDGGLCVTRLRNATERRARRTRLA